jgi:hypothetical protein
MWCGEVLNMGRGLQNEVFVVPALQQLGGTASVTHAGHLLYTFPELQSCAGKGSASPRAAPGASQYLQGCTASLVTPERKLLLYFSFFVVEFLCQMQRLHEGSHWLARWPPCGCVPHVWLPHLVEACTDLSTWGLPAWLHSVPYQDRSLLIVSLSLVIQISSIIYTLWPLAKAYIQELVRRLRVTQVCCWPPLARRQTRSSHPPVQLSSPTTLLLT